MEVKVLQNLPLNLDVEDLAARLKLDDEMRDEFGDIFKEALAVARPKMLYGRAEVVRKEGNVVAVGGMEFRSKVLYINMEKIRTAYPYVATGGRELFDLAKAKADPLERYWIDSIAEAALRAGLAAALERIRHDEGTGALYAMNPGSLPDWPIAQQRPLFRLLGDVMEKIGVELTESMLMLPVKSVSGLLFESEEHYTNCSMCPREWCVGRREPFNPELYKEKYHLDEAEGFSH